MPLLDIPGSTDLRKTFYIVFVFLSGETEENYYVGLEILGDIIKRREIEKLKDDCYRSRSWLDEGS